MNKIDKIFKNEMYIEALAALEKYEENREFCKHDMNHFIDMARIAYIIVLEEGLKYSKDIIYAIGLLHDIGRVKQYESNIPHDEASVIMAKEILKHTDFTDEEKSIIIQGIDSHRKESENKLEEIIYRSDKLSRRCFDCKAEKECYWSKEKKNFTIKY